MPFGIVNAEEITVFPYRLTDGKQYEICNALLSAINTVPHGSIRNDPSPLELVKDIKLPNWTKAKEKKYIDLFIKFEKQYLSEQFSDEKYSENFHNISNSLKSGSLVFYTAKADMDNSGITRPLLRIDSWYEGKRSGGHYIYIPYIEDTMDLEGRYMRESEGEIIFFRGRTFRFEEWLNRGKITYWQVNITEPYFLHDRSPRAFPPTGTKLICKFIAR